MSGPFTVSLLRLYQAETPKFSVANKPLAFLFPRETKGLKELTAERIELQAKAEAKRRAAVRSLIDALTTAKFKLIDAAYLAYRIDNHELQRYLRDEPGFLEYIERKHATLSSS